MAAGDILHASAPSKHLWCDPAGGLRGSHQRRKGSGILVVQDTPSSTIHTLGVFLRNKGQIKSDK